MKKLLSVPLALGLIALMALPAAAYTFPSTNALNMAKLTPGYEGKLTPYVHQVAVGPGTVTLEFVGGYVGGAWFEYRLDGQVKTSGNPHPVVLGDVIYPNIGAAANATVSQTFTAQDKVEIRLALGGERDWDFDWTPFLVGPNPTVSCEAGSSFVPSTGGTVNLAVVPGHEYRIDVSGTYYAGGVSTYDIRADAQYSQDTYQRINSLPWTDSVRNYEGYGDILLDLMVDGQNVDWGPYAADHEYSLTRVATDGVLSFAFAINDIYPSNNTGGLCVSVDDLGSVATVEGFFAPVNMDEVNLAKAGQTIPLKWRAFDHNGQPISDPDHFLGVSSQTGAGACVGEPTDAIETYAGTSGLQYLGDGYWQFNWKTPKSYAGQCRTVTLELFDATLTADLQFKG